MIIPNLKDFRSLFIEAFSINGKVPKIIGIYYIKNLINDKIYVGQSRNIYNRWRTHIKFGAQNKERPLYQFMFKKGLDKFDFQIIEVFEDNLENIDDILNEKEIYYIKYFKSLVDEGSGYNLVDECRNKKHSIVTKQKLSKMKKGTKRNLTEEQVQEFYYRGEDHYSTFYVISLPEGEVFSCLNEAEAKYKGARSTFYKTSISTKCGRCFLKLQDDWDLLSKEEVDNSIETSLNPYYKETTNSRVSVQRRYRKSFSF